MKLNRQLAERTVEIDDAIEEQVRAILQDIRQNGDAAVRKYAKRFDQYDGGFLLPRTQTGVDRERDIFEDRVIAAAAEQVDCDFVRILERAKTQIEAFHEKQIGGGFEIKKPGGVVMGQLVRPLQRVAVYVPGGTASYPSSVLMNVIPAKLAGVPEIALFCPDPNREVLAAAKVCGVDTIYKLGGVQAIGAAAYGTETIRKFDKIVGPGNIWVATAKRLVYGAVDIDMVAGPSEILIIADEHADPKYVAADLMSQAEHDTRARAILVTTSEKLIGAVENELERQLAYLGRKAIIQESLQNYGAAILVDSIDAAFDVSNDIAPEHLEVLLDEPMQYLDKINNAGSIFLGAYTPEPLGDYMSGTNHVLPTGGTAKFYSPLGVYDFVKFSAYSYYPRHALADFKEDVVQFAQLEGLPAHANSMKVRF